MKKKTLLQKSKEADAKAVVSKRKISLLNTEKNDSFFVSGNNPKKTKLILPVQSKHPGSKKRENEEDKFILPLKRKKIHNDANAFSKKKQKYMQRKLPMNFIPSKGKPSDYCKNPKCMKTENMRRRKQSGMKGYCVKCAPVFISKEALKAHKIKHQQVCLLRKEKFPCDFCEATYYFRCDIKNGKH